MKDYNYLQDYDKIEELSNLMDQDKNKIFVGIKPQEVSADIFKWVENTFKFGEDFKNNCDENIYIGQFHDVYVECPKQLQSLHYNSLFFTEKMLKFSMFRIR